MFRASGLLLTRHTVKSTCLVQVVYCSVVFEMKTAAGKEIVDFVI